MNIDISPGWCCRTSCPSPVGCPCVRVPGSPELCVSCVVRELGLPPETDAGGVAAELLRRSEP